MRECFESGPNGVIHSLGAKFSKEQLRREPLDGNASERAQERWQVTKPRPLSSSGEMGTSTRIKVMAALLLLGALALPQSTCAGYRAADGKFVPTIRRGAATGAYQPMVHRDYAFDDFRLAEPGTWLKIAAFLWPLPLLVVAARGRSPRLSAYISFVEPVLALGSALTIWFSASVFATPAAGAYVAVSALAVYLVVSALE